MLSDGVIVDDFTLIKIKAQLVRTLGFQNVSITPAGTNSHASHLSYGEIRSIPELAYPCFGNLMSLLDSWHKVELPSPVININSHDDGKEVEVLYWECIRRYSYQHSGHIRTRSPPASTRDQTLAWVRPYRHIQARLRGSQSQSLFQPFLPKGDYEDTRPLGYWRTIWGSTDRIPDNSIFLQESDHPYKSTYLVCSVFSTPNISLKFCLRSVVEKILSLQPIQADQLFQDSLAEQECFSLGMFSRSQWTEAQKLWDWLQCADTANQGFAWTY